MKSKIEADKQKRFFFIQSESSFIFLKCASTQNKQALVLLKIIPKKTNFSCIRSRCARSFRGRFILRAFKLSRIYFHIFAKINVTHFLKKASWLFSINFYLIPFLVFLV